MNPEIKAKWVAALRSGEFRKARHYLFNDGGYCCIGVLACIQGVDLQKDERFKGDDALMTSTLPEPLMAGLDAFATSLLAEMNDGHGLNHPPKQFSEIADYIEVNL